MKEPCETNLAKGLLSLSIAGLLLSVMCVLTAIWMSNLERRIEALEATKAP